MNQFTMTTPKILQLLYSFNTFSPEFSLCLDRLIQSDEEDHYLSNLQGLELTRLVDFLDKVRVFPSASSSSRGRFFRPSESSLSPKTFPDDVCTSCKSSVATAWSYHLRILLPAVWSELAITRLPLQIFPMCGRARTTAPECVSNTRESQ